MRVCVSLHVMWHVRRNRRPEEIAFSGVCLVLAIRRWSHVLARIHAPDAGCICCSSVHGVGPGGLGMSLT